MQVPVATIVTVVPDSVHAAVVVEEKATVNPELAVALTPNGASPNVLPPSAPKVIA